MKIDQAFFNHVAEAVAAFLTICMFVIGGLLLVSIAFKAVQDAIPDAQLFVDVAFFTMALAFSFGALQKIDALEVKMVGIDKENDRRDDATSDHIEVVLQDVQWLVKRELERNGEPTGDPFDPEFVGPPRPEFDSRDIPS